MKIFLWEHWSLHGARWDKKLLSHIIDHEIVQSINECDLIVCADIASNDHRLNTSILHAALTLKSDKPLIVFMPDDPDDLLPLLYPEDEHRLVIFRTSLCRSLQAPYEKCQPTFSAENIKPFPTCLPQSIKPRIGFCGTYCHTSRKDVCTILKNDVRFETQFIIRQNFHFHENVQTQAIHKEEFEKIMNNCVYQVCCRGAGNFSHRFYETLAYGRIPILLDTDICLPEHVPQELWDKCVIMVKTVEELPGAILSFHTKYTGNGGESLLQETQSLCRSLWADFLSVKAFATLVVEPAMKNVLKQPIFTMRKFIDFKYDLNLHAEFGGLDVTKQLPQNETFIVSTTLFSDPQPNVYKFLKLTKNGETICIGENETVENIENLFETYNIPNSITMAPLTSYMHKKKGLEIGGPSNYGVRPTGIYTLPLSMDNLHISDPVGPFGLPGKTTLGATFNGDIVRLSQTFLPNSFDFVFASHVLEHVKNPLQALCEMWHVLRTNGFCILILPFKEVTFDHRRPITDFKELVTHFENKETEDDVMDHVTPELLQQYDFSRDEPAGTPEQFVERCRQNNVNRCLHVHVFDFKLTKQCFDFAHFKLVYMQLSGAHQIIVGQKFA